MFKISVVEVEESNALLKPFGLLFYLDLHLDLFVVLCVNLNDSLASLRLQHRILLLEVIPYEVFFFSYADTLIIEILRPERLDRTLHRAVIPLGIDPVLECCVYTGTWQFNVILQH